MKIIPTEKAFFELLLPELVFYIIAYDRKNNRPNGMISSWTMKCSFEPFLFAVSLWKKGYTHKLIQKEKEFVVAVPGKSLKRSISVFGELHGDKVNKFEMTKIATRKAKFVEPPLLDDALLNFECKVVKEINAGDHILFIGKVLVTHFNDKLNKNSGILLNLGFKNDKADIREFKKR
ncbi:MAG: flavin reductase family protein [Atribacterota bacterium]|nr:flavin reductase family protein [Atribacterota bacterium]